MTLETVGLFAITELILCLSPGPAVIFVVSVGLRRRLRQCFAATAGILAANLMYFALSALGVGAVILASATLFTLIKWVGALYLAYLGFQMLVPLLRRLNNRASLQDETSLQPATVLSANDDRTAFRRGFVLQASNPKIIVFFVAILPLFVEPGGNIAGQIFVLGFVSVSIEFLVLISYAYLAIGSARYMTSRITSLVDGIGGGILISMGAALAMYRRAQ